MQPTNNPPAFALKLLRILCPPYLLEGIEGDLMEEFENNVADVGEKRARRKFIWAVTKFMRPGIVLRNKFIVKLFNVMMIRNYFNVSIRNLRLNPLYSGINIMSLAIGLTACIAIYLFIKDEQSFDTFHENANHIYRLDEIQNFTGTNEQKVALSMSTMGQAMITDFPEVKSFTRYWNRGRLVLQNNEKQLLCDNAVAVDSTFLSIFDFKLLAGDRNTALNEPNSILISEKVAYHFFDSPQEALGKTFTVQDMEIKITGVLQNIPENSHLQFEVLQSISTYTRRDPSISTNWDSNFLNTYLVLHPNVKIKDLEAKFPDFMVRHTGDQEIVKNYTLFLQALKDVHLGSNDIEHDYNNYRKFNGAYLNVFIIVGAFILLIASVNFMNLTTARASHRWKEIGVRKSIGAKKTDLFGQFIFESIFLAGMSLVLALLLAALFVPLLNQLIDRKLEMISLLQNPFHLGLFILLAIFLGLLTGIYPSFYMTSFNMSAVLKGIIKDNGKSGFGNSLVVLQFGLALAMIVCTLVVIQQLSFMQNSNAGFDRDQIVLIDMNREVNQKFDLLKSEWQNSTLVAGVTASGQRLGNNFHQWGFKVKTDKEVKLMTPSNVNVDYDYLKIYGIKLKNGRDFSKEFETDNGHAFIINETMEKELALKDVIGTPVGHAWYHDDSLGSIIGVVKDFNFNSMHHKINTLSLVCHPDWGYNEISIKIDGAKAQEAIAAIKAVWDKNITTYPFNYTFLDDHFNTLYRSDKQMSYVVTIVSALAILISCMGLFGLVAITVKRKVKEIGIRKALGASEFQITTLLTTKFAKLIVLSFLIVSPITYYLALQWLDTFAYRIGISPWVFLAGGIITFLVAFLTILYHTIKSAHESPVKSLRYE